MQLFFVRAIQEFAFFGFSEHVTQHEVVPAIAQQVLLRVEGADKLAFEPDRSRFVARDISRVVELTAVTNVVGHPSTHVTRTAHVSQCVADIEEVDTAPDSGLPLAIAFSFDFVGVDEHLSIGCDPEMNSLHPLPLVDKIPDRADILTSFCSELCDGHVPNSKAQSLVSFCA